MTSLPIRFVDNWKAEGWTKPGDRVAVACSGGLDSLTLLHIVRFRAPELGVRPIVAHFDHRIRQESFREAEWLQGLAGAWEIPFRIERATIVPEGEAGARTLRYRFLEGLILKGEVKWVLTAHHADDQVETILFRILRGTGLEGLRGIPASRDPGIIRPLLPFTRAELEDYAGRHRLEPRLDPTNRSTRFARNRVRHEVLPLLEEIHPGTRKSLLRLARNSHRTSEALNTLVDLHLEVVTRERTADHFVWDLAAATSYPDSVLGAFIRRATAGWGVSLTEAGTGLAVEFMRTASSGAQLDLPGSVRLEIEFGRLRVSRLGGIGVGISEGASGNDALEIRSPEAGQGEFYLSGRRFQVSWGPIEGSVAGPSGRQAGWKMAEFGSEDLAFPILARGWRPGDRIRIAGGRKKLTKLFREAEVPRAERDRLPVFVDSEGLVVWLPDPPGVRIGGDGGRGVGWSLSVRELEAS